MRNSELTYVCEQETPLKKYIFEFIFFILGYYGKKVNDVSTIDHIDIYYGNKCPVAEKCSLIIMEQSGLDVLWKPLLAGKISDKSINKVIDFDIINAISILITDKVNEVLPDEAYDEHDRLVFGHSFQAKLRVAETPLVNVYLRFLEDLFKQKYPHMRTTPLWPEGKKCAIGLSHDVDRPDKYTFLKAPFFLKNKTLKENLWINLRKASAAIKYITDKHRDNYWLFKDILQSEEQLGFQSTFFFAAVNSFDEYGAFYDVDYDITNDKFLAVFDEILKREFEIGLHASYNAYLNKHHFVYEKQKIEDITKIKLKGLRHHYWHMRKDQLRTLRMHEFAGFEYDSSIAFNDSLGFRRNIALPYFPWDEGNGCKLNIMELPVFCMDDHLFCRPIEIYAAVDELKKFLETIKQLGGVGVIDWHVKSSYPKNSKYLNWGKTYIKLLEHLSNESEIWVTSLGNISDWLKNRSKTIYG